MTAANATAYLVNTGWNGTGKRISIKDTRAIIDTILGGELDCRDSIEIPYFNLAIPTALSNTSEGLLDPRNSYQNPAQWDSRAKALAKKFIDNFVQFTDTEAGKILVAAGPHL